MKITITKNEIIIDGRGVTKIDCNNLEDQHIIVDDFENRPSKAINMIMSFKAKRN